jgi:hypothetical protein
MKMYVYDSAWRRTLWFMRIACPLVFLAAVVLGIICWWLESYSLVAVNALIAGINLILSWVQWRVFEEAP